MSQELDGKLDSANATGFIQGLDNQKERHELLLEFGKVAASAGFFKNCRKFRWYSQSRSR